MDDFDYDQFDSNDIIDNNFWDRDDMFMSGVTGDFSDPFWQTQEGIDMHDNIVFDDPYGNLDQTDYSWYDDGGSVNPISGSNSPLSGIAKFINGLANGSGGGVAGDLGEILANLGSLYMTGNDIAQKNETNSLLQDLLRNQRDLNNATMKTNANNDYRSFTGQAGGLTGDAYNVAMNKAKMDLMMSLMANDDKIGAADKNALSQAFGNIQYAYEPVYQGYANDAINRRNYEYSAPYNSLAPFTPRGQEQTYGVNNTAINTVPANADPASVDAYRNYVLGNLG